MYIISVYIYDIIKQTIKYISNIIPRPFGFRV